MPRDRVFDLRARALAGLDTRVAVAAARVVNLGDVAVLRRDLQRPIGRGRRDAPRDRQHEEFWRLTPAGIAYARSHSKLTEGEVERISNWQTAERLGLEKVYIQAERWKNNVGSPEVQAFMGALQLQGASKGVFITTSACTRDAASRARGTIVLVDGAQLTVLMIDHGVGVSHKALRIPKVDGDYFEDA